MADVPKMAQPVMTLPVFVDHAAVTQVHDARTAAGAQAPEGRRVRRDVQKLVGPVARTLHPRTMVRRADENKPAQLSPPRMVIPLRAKGCAAGNQAAHTV